MKNFNLLTTEQKDMISIKTSIDFNLSSFHSIIDFIYRREPARLSSIANDFDNFINTLSTYVEEASNTRKDTETSED